MNTTLLVTLAQDVSRYSSGVRWVQWGTTAVGVAILIGAAGVLLQRPKPETSVASIRVQKVVGAILAIVGFGVIVYAWAAHSTM